MFCALNGCDLTLDTDTAVTAMLAIAAGEWDEVETEAWLRAHIVSTEGSSDRS